MKLILICGKARSGKDTFADFLEEDLKNRNYKVCRLAYSDYIKYYIKKYFGWNGNDDAKPRDLMNEIGTKIIREKINKHFHVNRILEDLEVLSYYFDIAIISDVREPIEIEIPKQKLEDCLSIKVTRPNYVSTLTKEQQQAYTETALDNYNNYDFVITNDQTLEDLKTKAHELIENEVIK